VLSVVANVKSTMIAGKGQETDKIRRQLDSITVPCNLGPGIEFPQAIMARFIEGSMKTKKKQKNKETPTADSCNLGTHVN
jgi:hypothetical protein